MPALSQGTMNNMTVGGVDPRTGEPFAYYETVGGGMGAGPRRDGLSGVHVHMSNSLNTPIEALEHAYPFRIIALRHPQGNGRRGRAPRGRRPATRPPDPDPARVALLCERRAVGPAGAQGGEDGAPGENVLIRAGVEERLPAKATFSVEAGDVVSIRSPGGGGWGRPHRD